MARGMLAVRRRLPLRCAYRPSTHLSSNGSVEHLHGHHRARVIRAPLPRLHRRAAPSSPFPTPAAGSRQCPPPVVVASLAGNHEYDYPASQDGSKDPSGAGAMWSPPWWNGGSDSGGECGMPTARRFRTPVSQQPVARPGVGREMGLGSMIIAVDDIAGERQRRVLVQLRNGQRCGWRTVCAATCPSPASSSFLLSLPRHSAHRDDLLGARPLSRRTPRRLARG